MSRSGYTDDCGGWELIMYRGAVAAAIRGARGQKLLRDLAAALDAMPNKRLITEEFVRTDGEVCALGALGQARGIPRLNEYDYDDAAGIAGAFGVAPSLVREIMYENDDSWTSRTPEKRWTYMRKWIERHLINDGAAQREGVAE